MRTCRAILSHAIATPLELLVTFVWTHQAALWSAGRARDRARGILSRNTSEFVFNGTKHRVYYKAVDLSN